MEEQQRIAGSGIERRDFLRNTATVAFAAPVIVSLLSGPARAQVGGIGEECGTKSGGVGSTTCNVTAPCGTMLECRADPTNQLSDDCFCFA